MKPGINVPSATAKFSRAAARVFGLLAVCILLVVSLSGCNDSGDNFQSSVGAPNPNLPPQVTVELVNDSGVDDANVFLLLDSPDVAVSVTGPLKLLADSGSSTANGTGVALKSLWPAGAGGQPVVQSTYTGKSLPVYPIFTTGDLTSGRLSVSFNTAISIVNGHAPTAQELYRFDKMEISFANATGGGNLTSIDFYGIPLQVEVTHSSETSPDPLQTKTFYASTPTILQALFDLSPGSMVAAFLDTSGKPFKLTDDLTTFARVLSPNTIAAMPTSNGSPSPYPSFSSYLTSLVGKTFILNGTQHGGYSYTASVASDGASGYKVTCTGTLNVPPVATPPATKPPPNDATVTLNLPVGQLDFFIYADVANINSYSLNGVPFTNQGDVDNSNASAYGAIVGDVQAALNFGYLGGRFGSSIGNWYASIVLPYAYPYGGARTTNDGYYNPYAGLFYYLSDAYGHPFSDRIASASPLYTLKSGDKVRITILNDQRLDTPLVSVAGATDTTLALSWPIVSGATSYTLDVKPPPTVPIAIVPANAVPPNPQTTTLTGLQPGTPYVVSVAAAASNAIAGAPVAVQSATLPVQGATTGARTPLNNTGSSAVTFQVALNVAGAVPVYPPYLAGIAVTVNGQAVDATHPALVSGAIGTNIFGVQIRDPDNNLVYQGNYFVALMDASGGKFTVGDPFLLQYNLTPLTQAGPPGTPPYPNANFQLTIGTPFNPKPFYQRFTARFP